MGRENLHESTQTTKKVLTQNIYISTPSVIGKLKYPAQALGPEWVGLHETVAPQISNILIPESLAAETMMLIFLNLF